MCGWPRIIALLLATIDSRLVSSGASVPDDHASAHHDARTTDDDHPVVILVIVVGTALIDISPATILLGLAGRHSTVVPPRLLSVVPSRGTLIRIAVSAVLVSVAVLPSLVGILIAVRAVRISLGLAIFRYQSRSK